MSALLSVVIPTFRRPLLLKRAIESALACSPDGDVEVRVVPNGPDDSWTAVAESLRHETRVHWHKIHDGNACAARNHGMAKSRGKYIRFLDDDDYLFPPIACGQLEAMEAKRLDICSAPLLNVQADSGKATPFALPKTDDFCAATLLSIGIAGFCQGSVFLRDTIKDLRWDESAILYDDYLWMLSMAAAGDPAWMQLSTPVGAYFHHHSPRLSQVFRSSGNSRRLLEAITSLHADLRSSGRNCPARDHAVATALLTLAHSAFPASPLLLSRGIRVAQAISPGAAPLQSVFNAFPLLARHLLTVEWTAMLPRYATRSWRRATWIIKARFMRPVLN